MTLVQSTTMTSKLMTHPLTEEIMDSIHGDAPGYDNPYDEDDMRAAADWQLNQVVEWLRNSIDVDYIIEDLTEAMRPTTQED